MAEQTAVAPETVETKPITPVETQVESKSQTLLGEAKEEGKVETSTEAKPEGKEESKPTETTSTVPEKYELTLPEGFSVDQTAVETLTPIFKELNLSNDAVNKLANAYAPVIKSQIESQQKAAIDAWTKETEGWKSESLKLLGADAPKELAFAAKIINKFGTKYKGEDGSEGNKLRDVFEDTKVGNHPEITKLFISLGKLISQDHFVEPNQTTTGQGGLNNIYDHPDSKATLTS